MLKEFQICDIPRCHNQAKIKVAYDKTSELRPICTMHAKKLINGDRYVWQVLKSKNILAQYQIKTSGKNLGL